MKNIPNVLQREVESQSFRDFGLQWAHSQNSWGHWDVSSNKNESISMLLLYIVREKSDEVTNWKDGTQNSLLVKPGFTKKQGYFPSTCNLFNL